MLRLLKHCLIISILVAQSAFAASQNVETAKDQYLKLFNPDQTQEGVKYLNNDIAKLLLEDSRMIRDQKESLESFANEIRNVDVASIVKSYNIPASEMPKYADNVSRRLVALGFKIEDHSREVEQLGSVKKMIYGSLIGLASGLLVYRKMIIRSKGQADITGLGLILTSLSSTVAGGSAGAALDYFDKKEDKKSFNKVIAELDRISQINVQKLKGTKVEKMVNELE